MCCFDTFINCKLITSIVLATTSIPSQIPFLLCVTTFKIYSCMHFDSSSAFTLLFFLGLHPSLDYLIPSIPLFLPFSHSFRSLFKDLILFSAFPALVIRSPRPFLIRDCCAKELRKYSPSVTTALTTREWNPKGRRGHPSCSGYWAHHSEQPFRTQLFLLPATGSDGSWGLVAASPLKN